MGFVSSRYLSPGWDMYHRYVWSLMIWTPLLGGVSTIYMNYTHTCSSNIHGCAMIKWRIALRGWIRMNDLKDLYGLQGLYSFDVSLIFWRWYIICLVFVIALKCRVGWSERHVCMMWRICMNDPKNRLSTHSNYFTWFRVIFTCVPGGIWLIFITRKRLAGRGSVWLQFS